MFSILTPFFFKCIHLDHPNLYILTLLSSNSGRMFTLTFPFPDTVSITVSISRFIFDIIDVAVTANSLAFRFLFSTREIIPPLTIDGVKTCENYRRQCTGNFLCLLYCPSTERSKHRFTNKTILAKTLRFLQNSSFPFFPFSYTYPKLHT